MANFASLRDAFPVPPGNETSPVGLTHLPNTILESFIPGYSFLSGFILEVFEFDVSIFVSVLLLLFGVISAGGYIYRHLRILGYSHLTSSITVYYRDELFDTILSWISDHDVTKTGRNLRVKSLWASAWDADDYVDIGTEINGLVNFRAWTARIPPQFEPHSTSAWFWYKGNCFQVSRQLETIDRRSGGFTYAYNEELLTIRVIGRSVDPIKRLIREAKDTTLAKESNKTAILRPNPKQASGNGIQNWTRVARRPSRPIETVVLDADEKEKILLDINEYLHPTTRRWYANRGIPYRRGYLFYGPPGTGKTSLSFAIAGVFGLNIFCISLMEPTLTEGDLAHLFNILPPRCVVLLEDIDSAGLTRKIDNKIESTSKATEDATEEPQKPNPKPAPRKKKPTAGGPDDNEQSPGISLSGLLNAIDGVASHEGRVLVMTTNHPERLDEALIRPGRVDMQIEFTLATRKQIGEIFAKMYSGAEAVLPPVSSKGTVAEKKDIGVSAPASRWPLFRKSARGSIDAFVSRPLEKHDCTCTAPSSPSSSILTPSTSTSIPDPNIDDGSLSSLSISDLSHIFASRLPERTFSPAEVQGFLLTRKREPVRAVREVEEWCAKMVAEKEKKKNSRVDVEGKDTAVVNGKDPRDGDKGEGDNE